MLPSLLLDTHVLIRWHFDSRRLSREQSKAMQLASRKSAPFAFSAVTLIEIALLHGDGNLKLRSGLDQFLAELEESPDFLLLPVTAGIASDFASLHLLRDPFDRAIVATARVHRLQLVTSDQRIAASNLVPIID